MEQIEKQWNIGIWLKLIRTKAGYYGTAKINSKVYGKFVSLLLQAMRHPDPWPESVCKFLPEAGARPCTPLRSR